MRRPFGLCCGPMAQTGHFRIRPTFGSSISSKHLTALREIPYVHDLTKTSHPARRIDECEMGVLMKMSIRLAQKGDAKAFVDSWNDSFRKGHLRYTATQRRKREDVRRLDARYSENKKNLMFVAVGDGAIIGTCGLTADARGRTRHRGELGWYVHYDYVGKGIGARLLAAALREARKRGFKRVEAEIAIENTASIRLARRFRFRLEGRRKAGILLDDGRHVDTLIFGKVFR